MKRIGEYQPPSVKDAHRIRSRVLGIRTEGGLLRLGLRQEFMAGFIAAIYRNDTSQRSIATT